LKKTHRNKENGKFLEMKTDFYSFQILFGLLFNSLHAYISSSELEIEETKITDGGIYT